MEEEYDPFRAWIESHEMSARLHYSLKRYHKLHPSDALEEITKEKFISVWGVGKKQWQELEELREGSRRK